MDAQNDPGPDLLSDWGSDSEESSKSDSQDDSKSDLLSDWGSDSQDDSKLDSQDDSRSNSLDKSSSDLLNWYAELPARRVDLVGDYAGSELFLVEGDSLLLKCWSDLKLDFQCGFQLLHAIYAVENFIQGLVQRKCNFHLVFFDQHEEACIPSKTKPPNRYKYLLARTVLIRHLQVHLPRSQPSLQVVVFNSIKNAKFKRYLEASGVYFMLCHDGANPTASDEGFSSRSVENIDTNRLEIEDLSKKITFRTIIRLMISQSYNIALINGLEWMDTKVMTMVVESSRKNKGLPKIRSNNRNSRKEQSSEEEVVVEPLLLKLGFNTSPCPSREKKQLTKTEQPPYYVQIQGFDESISRYLHAHGSSERFILTLITLSHILKHRNFEILLLLSFMIHTILIGEFRISERPQMQRGEMNKISVKALDFLEEFSNISRQILSGSSWRFAMENHELHCDIADLVDGRLYTTVVINVTDVSCHNGIDLTRLRPQIHGFVNALEYISGEKIALQDLNISLSGIFTSISFSDSNDVGILPFSNPVFDRHLASINIRIDHSTVTDLQSARIFQEVSHWHNVKRKIDPKATPLVLEKEKSRALKRNQFFMTEMQAYAASLTNAAGKVLDPDSVTVLDKKKVGKNYVDHKESEESGGSKKYTNARSGSSRKAEGKRLMYESIAASKAAKDDDLTKKLFLSWQTVRKGLEAESLNSKYVKIKAYLGDLQENKRVILQAEVEFYLLTILVDIYRTRCDKKSESGISDEEEFYGIAALIWDTIRRLALASGLTSTISEHAKQIVRVLGMPSVDFVPSAADRKLSFNTDFAFSNAKNLLLDLGPIEFQCRYCGPYMDRDLDSAFDPRVTFKPDGWQRQVLDELDADRSVFVVAPTSAGKTFISFYAMERVLKMDDDSVLVYVAPTKALVNQIAAEIQGKFKKTYKYAGKSVWAIHTRDYRVNNPSGCQILVTVPHILQIMLLAPNNAKTWSKKVKTIIFDEIHSIGNAEDGVVWEQLLLLAPCPIIALSATVGNPEQFNSWLASTQKSAGYELTMIKHLHRYSDLRKFVYRPPKHFGFYGLSEKAFSEKDPLAPLGLDGLENFAFVHPVASLVNKSKGMPEDLSFESRDCLSLWKTMLRHQTKDFPVDASLSPSENGLSAVIRKADILKWEKKLKELLQDWMRHNNSPFDKVIEDLSKSMNDVSRPINQTSRRYAIDSESGKPSGVNSGSLLSTTLPLLCNLHERDALPAILFCYDRSLCEDICQSVLKQLISAEARWKSKSAAWKKKLRDWNQWKLEQTKLAGKKPAKILPKKKGQEREDDGLSNTDRVQDAASNEASPFASFDPEAPVDGFHFAVKHKLELSELKNHFWHLKRRGIAPWLMEALTRGIGVHHAGMNRKYRQVVEMLFRKGYLRVVIATGTLALGINMPCATVVFSGDSVFLTALNFRQGAGRAGRRGFDLLGNVVFQSISDSKVCRLISSRLPDLNGHFPITTSLVLRLFTLLHDSGDSPYAARAINSLLSQPRLYLDGLAYKEQVLHHLRFSIEYLRRHSLLSSRGIPLNFAGLTSHLYYTENSAFALNALLKGGFFHGLCSAIDDKESSVLRSMMVVMAHIFGRRPCRQVDQEYIDNIVKRSQSIVFLPPLPSPAAQILRQHNQDTLQIFTAYVKTFVEQHMTADDYILPLTRSAFGGDNTLGKHNAASPSVKVRSAFVALSGHGDTFDSISDLCRTTRAGVFLEEAVIPHLDVYPDEVDTPLNAYLYDFYMHGDLGSLERANGIPRSDVWFLLNDFSMVLATITASLASFLKISASDDINLIDVIGEGDEQANLEDDEFATNLPVEKTDTVTSSASSEKGRTAPSAASSAAAKPRSKAKVADSWSDDDEDDPASGNDEDTAAEADDRSVQEIEQGFKNIYKAFSKLRVEFDTKFKKIFA